MNGGSVGKASCVFAPFPGKSGSDGNGKRILSGRQDGYSEPVGTGPWQEKRKFLLPSVSGKQIGGNQNQNRSGGSDRPEHTEENYVT